eukprot:498666-Rhodomonas_salina.5
MSPFADTNTTSRVYREEAYQISAGALPCFESRSRSIPDLLRIRSAMFGTHKSYVSIRPSLSTSLVTHSRSWATARRAVSSVLEETSLGTTPWWTTPTARIKAPGKLKLCSAVR